MIIHRFRAQRFGCLADTSVSFGPGLNIVSGPNESGKSTLQRALLLALLDRPAKRKANEDSRQWGAERLFQLDLDFETSDGRLWALSKDYQDNKARLAGADGSTSSWEEIQEILSGALGTPSPKALQSTCCVAQDELAAITDGQKEISRSLETMVTGGEADTSTSDAIAALQRALLGLRRGFGAREAANPGRLATLADRKRALEALAATQHASLEQDELARQRLAECRERLLQLETALQPRLATRDAAEQALNLVQELREWRERESALSATLDRIEQAEGRISSATAGLTELGLPSLTQAGYYELARLHERVALLESQALARAQSPHNGPEVAQGRAWPWPWRAGANGAMAPALLVIVATCLGITVTAAGMLAGAPPLLLALVIAACTIMDAVGIVWFLRELRRPDFGGGQRGQGATLTMRDGWLADETQLERESRDLAQRLDALGCSDWQTLETRQQKSRALQAQLDNAKTLLEGLLPAGKSGSNLEEARKAASLKRRDLEEALNGSAYQRALRLGAVEFQSLGQEIVRLTLERQTLTTEAIGLQARLDASRLNTEDLMTVDEQLGAVATELLRAEETVAVYTLMMETMQAARERTLVRARDQLAPLAGAYLSELTGGRYTSVRVDSDLNVLVLTPGGPAGSVEPGRLSKGTQDQLYFALRLALMDLLFPSARPPLFLDDPFVKFDVARQQAALLLCQRIAQQRQVILFTCSTECDQWGHVISMPAPSA
jgi:hypothetical protein